MLAPSLTIMFSVCVTMGYLPFQWKRASVVPIFKKGDKHSVKNYSPVSLLNSVSKVLERCISNLLYPHVEPHIHPLQHGFVKHRSCTTQLLKVYNAIGQILDRGGQVDIIFLDFSKAFDCILHDLLLHKLKVALMV